MLGLTARRDELQHQIKVAHEPPPLLHPSMADLYREKVEQLAAALQADGSRLEASETLRGLIDSIVLIPQEGQLRIELRGNLAAMLAVAQETKRSPETGDLVVPVQLVAGACNQLPRSPFHPRVRKCLGRYACERHPARGGTGKQVMRLILSGFVRAESRRSP